MKKLHLVAAALCVTAFTLHSTSAADAKKKPDADAKPADAKDAPAAKSSYTLPDTVAVVEGSEIKRAEVEQALNAALAQHGQNPADVPDAQKVEFYRNVVDGLVIEKLVQKRSEKIEITDKEVDDNFSKLKSQFPTEDAMNAAIKQSGETLPHLKDSIRSSLREQKWIETQIAGKDAVSDADAQGFYDKNPDKFKAPEQVRASHILLMVPEGAKPAAVAEKEKLAKSISDRAKKGEAFDKLAKEFSEDPGSKDRGGDLSFFSHDQMVPEFADAAFKLKKDEISAPVKSQFGFHIIKATDRKDARTVPFTEAKEKILAYLKNDKRRTAVDGVISDLRAKADVKVNLPVAAAPASLPVPAPAK
jgi:peptidyl-prolyl cis-trans isomerase C